jgi:hypothetical protein
MADPKTTAKAPRSLRDRLLPTGSRSLLLDLFVLAILVVFLIPSYGVSFLKPPLLPDIKDEVARPGDKLPAPSAAKVLFIMVDALRADQALDPSLVPVLTELCERGACGTAIGSQVSVTVMGVLAAAVGQTNDFRWIFKDFDPDEYQGPNMLRSVRSLGKSTGLFGDDTWSALFHSSFSLIASRSGLPRWLYYREAVYGVDTIHMSRARHHLRAHQPDLSVIHLVGVDHTEHRYDIHGPEMKRKLRELDQMIRDLMAYAGPDTVIMLSSDHGASDSGNHAGAGVLARTTPFVVAGPGIKHVEGLDLDLRDWSVLITELMGAAIPGHSIGILPWQALDESPSEVAPRLLRNAWSMDRLRKTLAEAGHAEFAGSLPDAAPLRHAEERLDAGDPEAASAAALAWMQDFRVEWERAVAAGRLSFLLLTLAFAVFFAWLALRARSQAGGASAPGRRDGLTSTLVGAGALGLAYIFASCTQQAPAAPDPLSRADLFGLIGLLGAAVAAPLLFKLASARKAAPRLDAFGIAMLGASVLVLLGRHKVMPGLVLTPLVAALLLSSTRERRALLVALAGAWMLLALDAFDYRGKLPTGRGGMGLATFGGDIAGAVAMLGLGAIRARRTVMDDSITLSRVLRIALAGAAILALALAVGTMLQDFELRRSRLPYIPFELAGGTALVLLLAARTGAARHLVPVLAAAVWVTFAVRGQVLGMAGWWAAAELVARTNLVREGGARNLAAAAVMVVMGRFALISLFTGQISMDNLEIPVALMGNPEIIETLGAVHIFTKLGQPTLLALSVLWVAVPAGAGARLARWMIAIVGADLVGLFVQLLVLDAAEIPPYARAEDVQYSAAIMAFFLVCALLSALWCGSVAPARARAAATSAPVTRASAAGSG